MDLETPMIVFGWVTHEIQEGELCRMALGPCFSSSISCESPLGSPYEFGECELVGVLRHAPPSRVGCPTLGL